MKSIINRMILGAGVFLLAGALAPTARGQEYSHARIVRLSFVEGAVAVQRPDVDEWAAALVNTPIQEGFKVSTDEDGFAEVEFENASTARLGQASLLEFAQLALAPSGGKINRLRLHQGYATFNFIPEDDDYYEVTAGDATFLPHGKSRFRLDMQDDLLLVKVFKGSVEITSPEGSGTVGEDAMLELRRGGDPAFQITQGVTKDEWDEWVEKRESHVELVRNQGLAPAAGVYSNDATSLLYGFADLASYGQWVVLPGYGSAWAPNVGGGWAPYTYGRWCWYPGYGYTWISSEPWGWMPYHFGQWVYQPGYGWCWLPVNLTAWSPALVTWYRGPGWVGWTPAGSPRLGGGSAACQSPGGCGAAVSDNTFRDGGSVNPVRIHGINPTVDGRLVGSPDITPGRRGWLPGEPYRLANGPGAVQGPGQGSVPAAGQISVHPPQSGSSATSPAGRQLSTTTTTEPRVRTRTSSGGIVFDPEQRQYINADEPAKSTSPALTIQPTSAGEESKAPTAPSSTPSAPAESRGSRPVGSLVGAHRPSPQGNYPSRIIGPPPGRGVGTGNSISVSSGGRSGDDNGSRGAAVSIRTRDAETSGASSSGSSSVGRQAAGSSSRTSSAPSSGSSAGGDRSAGSGVSVGSSGGSSVSSGGSRGSMGGGGAGGGSRGPGGSSGGGRPTSSGRPPHR
jgi:hypothetical protein